MKRLHYLIALVVLTPCVVVAQDNHLEHVTNIEHEQVAGFDLDYPPTKPNVAFAVFRNTACREVISDADATSAVLTIVRKAWLGPLGYIISYGTDRDHFSSTLGRFDLYCVGGGEDEAAEQIVAVFATSGSSKYGSGAHAIDAYGLHRNGSTWEIRFPLSPSRLTLPGNQNYQFLGFLESSDTPWAFAMFFGEPAHSNTAVIDMNGNEVFVEEYTTPILVREKEDFVLYVTARERVTKPEDGQRKLLTETKTRNLMGRLSGTHRAWVLRRIYEHGNEVVEKVVYRIPPQGEDLPKEVQDLRERAEQRINELRKRGVVVAEVCW